MDVMKSVTYAFDDSDWPSKLGLGALVMWIPILNFAWSGYVIDVMRNVSMREPRPLPTWDDIFGRKFSDGLIWFASRLIYSLPGLLAFLLPFLFMLLPALVSDSDVQGVLATIGGGLTLLLIALFVIYALLLSVFMPAVQLNFANQGTFASCFNFGQILKWVTANPGDYLIACGAMIAMYFLLYTALGILGAILSVIPCIGFVFSLLLIPVNAVAAAWLGVVTAHLFGQIALNR